MLRVLLILFFALPPLAIVLNHDVISFVLIVVWTFAIIPLCVLWAIDFFRSDDKSSPAWIRIMMRVPIALLGILSSCIGLAIVAWCLYNVVIQRMPEYNGPGDAVGLWLDGFGIAPALLTFGWYLLRLSNRRVDESSDEENV